MSKSLHHASYKLNAPRRIKAQSAQAVGKPMPKTTLSGKDKARSKQK